MINYVVRDKDGRKVQFGETHDLDAIRSAFCGYEVTEELHFPETVQREPTYADLRRESYPPIADQLDALWKGGEALEAMRANVLAVKEMYPKPVSECYNSDSLSTDTSCSP